NTSPTRTAVGRPPHAGLGRGVVSILVVRANDQIVNIVEIQVFGPLKPGPIGAAIDGLENPGAPEIADADVFLTSIQSLATADVNHIGVAWLHRHRTDGDVADHVDDRRPGLPPIS